MKCALYVENVIVYVISHSVRKVTSHMQSYISQYFGVDGKGEGGRSVAQDAALCRGAAFEGQTFWNFGVCIAMC